MIHKYNPKSAQIFYSFYEVKSICNHSKQQKHEFDIHLTSKHCWKVLQIKYTIYQN